MFTADSPVPITVPGTQQAAREDVLKAGRQAGRERGRAKILPVSFKVMEMT